MQDNSLDTSVFMDWQARYYPTDIFAGCAPDVCRELGITCISLIGLLRREKWTL